MRSLYKLPPLVFDALKKFDSTRSQKYQLLLKQFKTKRKNDVLCVNVNATVDLSMVDQRVVVYNGRSFQAFNARTTMVGLKMKHIFRTKRLGRSMHFVNKRRKKKARSK
jgi:ribosomal protein S19